jgi:RNA polymerase sigma-54 factor
VKLEAAPQQHMQQQPALYQTMRILSMDAQALDEEIARVLEENPALEVDEKARELPDETGIAEREMYGYDGAGLSAGDIIERTAVNEETLSEHLLRQLSLERLSRDEFTLGGLIINNLDENGFHRSDPRLLCRSRTEEALLEGVLKRIQLFDPIGCAVNDIYESLAVQAAATGQFPCFSPEVLARALPFFEKKEFEAAAGLLRLSPNRTEAFYNCLRRLNPYPASGFSSVLSGYVQPDLRLDVIDGEVYLALVGDRRHTLKINAFFAEPEKLKTEEARRYARKALHEAQRFLNDISLRGETLLKIGQVIAEVQRSYFLQGIRFLKPLTMREVADRLGLHEATVSRTVNGKYLQTRNRFLPLRSLFSSGFVSHTGRSVSREAIKDTVRDILKAAGGKKISDQKIADILAGMGYTVARRTVTKYRKELLL